MFLSSLSDDDKIKFMSFLHTLANADGVVSQEERNHLAAYANEMGIENNAVYNCQTKEVFEHFKQRPETIRKIIYAESIALAYADGEFDESEQKLVMELQQELSLTDEFTTNITDWINKIKPLYADGFKLVGLI